MRILQIQGLAGGGGCEVHTYQLCRGLTERGHSVALLAADQPNPIIDAAADLGCEVVRFPLVPTWRRIADVEAVRRAVSLVRKHRIDLIHTHLWNADVVGWAAARITRTPVVCTLHGPTIPVSVERTWYHTLHLRLYAQILRRADGIIAISKFVRDHVAEDLGIDAAPIRVVYNASDVDVVGSAVRDPGYLRSQGVPDAQRYVIIVGVLTPRKGILDFIEAAARIRSGFAGVHFLVAGQGPLQEAAERRAAELGIASAISFLGWRQDVPQLLACSDVLAVTSYKEGFGRTITEAMSCAVPVVSFDSGAPGEILVDDESGLLVPEGDVDAFAEAVLRLLRDPVRAREIGVAGRERARSLFDVDRFVAATEAVLDEVSMAVQP